MTVKSIVSFLFWYHLLKVKFYFYSAVKSEGKSSITQTKSWFFPGTGGGIKDSLYVIWFGPIFQSSM